MPAIPINKPCNVLFPEHWTDDRIRASVRRLENDHFDVSYSIGNVEAPCVDTDYAYAFALIMRT
jgi:hypothetical protein